MKTNYFVAIDLRLLFSMLIVIFFSSTNAFAGPDPVSAGSQTVLVEINKKLDASKKREEQILANQEKIIAEILKSRKWAFNN